MMSQSVHMKDQKANQNAMRSRLYRQFTINRLEDLTVVVVLWGVFLLAGAG
ncbi:hypothetical protein NP590_09045 [Methylomonas sp. SURF-2]|uniref:Uncharacterized protein n=1 Tax=Methylomonas subterranea TaxID=2952225 RepID=A0ABT1TFP0_9GAMM|nr:hypothetical protein [Methylomonas sp. SURF-2]MCQ8104250.1 hypothetical protein [Methylomonas sp. SURF-2]